MIELESITKIYRMGKVEVPALRGINLTIDDGEAAIASYTALRHQP